MTTEEVRALLKEACEKAGGIRAFAINHKISPAHISNTIVGRRMPGPTILHVFGLEAIRHETIIYRKVKR